MPLSNKMFTIAVSTGHGDGDQPVTLLLYDKENAQQNLREVAEAMVRDPLFAALFPGTAYFRHAIQGETHNAVIIVEDDLSSTVVERLGTPGEVCVWNAESPQNVVLINYEDTYYNCHKPARTILGCASCVSSCTKEDPSICAVAAAVHTRNASWTSAEDAAEMLRPRKSVLGGFTYLSPGTTQLTPFQSKYQRAHFHDFNMVELRSASGRKASVERKRRAAFKESDCTKCAIKDKCLQGDSNYCNGAYVATPQELEDLLVQSTRFRDWTDAQIRTIMRYSGEHSVRYDAYIPYLTFTSDGDVVLRRATTGCIIRTFHGWDEIDEYLRGAARYYNPMPDDTPLPVGFRGVIAAACRIKYSPRSGFGTCADAVGVEGHSDSSVSICFRTSTGRGVYPFGIHLYSVYDIYDYYHDLNLVPQTSSVNRRRSQYEY